MPARVVLHSIEIAASADEVFSFVSDPSNLPCWAPRFAPAIEPKSDGVWSVLRDGQEIELRPRSSREFGVADFVRDGAGGAVAGAFVRIIRDSAESCIVIMTIPLAPTARRADVQQVVEEELESLRNILA